MFISMEVRTDFDVFSFVVVRACLLDKSFLTRGSLVWNFGVWSKLLWLSLELALESWVRGAILDCFVSLD